jgi:predicted PurR-regulated permease PerM
MSSIPADTAPADDAAPTDASVNSVVLANVQADADASPDAAPSAGWGPLHFLAVLITVAACWAARELLVPIFLGLFIGLVANPSVTWLGARLRVPRWIGAFFVVFGGVAIALALGSQLVAPAGEWVQKAPQELRQVAPKIRGLVRKVDEANRAAASIVSAAGAGNAPTSRRAAAAAANAAAAEATPKPPNLWSMIRAAPALLAWFGAVILLGYFFVVFGVDLQYKAIGLLPHRQQKRLTHEILRTIETELSRYVMTITMINAGLALVLSLVFWQLGLAPEDALLWGAIGGLLNFAPYVGPVLGVITLLVVGVVAFDQPALMLAPALCYLGLQLLESEVVTPIILGKRWSISPLVVLLWLLFCGWLWSIPGVLLAVPMLVSFKIVAERVDGLNDWARAIE